MKYIAIIVVVAIIAVAVIIGLLIQRWKNRQTEELEHVRGLKDLYANQVNAATSTLKTIRDLQGDSSFDAQIALDTIEQLREEHYNNQEREITK